MMPHSARRRDDSPCRLCSNQGLHEDLFRAEKALRQIKDELRRERLARQKAEACLIELLAAKHRKV